MKKIIPLVLMLGFFVSVFSANAGTHNFNSRRQMMNERAACQMRANIDYMTNLLTARKKFLDSDRTRANWFEYRMDRMKAGNDYKIARDLCKKPKTSPSPSPSITPTPTVTPTPTPTATPVPTETPTPTPTPTPEA